MIKNQFKPEVGDILFTSKKGPISWGLRFFLGPFRYSHLCVAGEPVDGRETVYTTGIGGGKGIVASGPPLLPSTRYRQLYMEDYLANKTYVVCRYTKDGKTGLSDEQKQKILAWCHSQLGNKFPFKKSGKFLRLMLKAKGVDHAKVEGQEKLYTCYQAVIETYLRIGVDLNPRAEHSDTSGYDAKEIYLSPYLTNVYKNF